MNQKDKFLKDVTKDIKYIPARKKIKKELENHILEGLDAGFSIDEIIMDMGDSKTISNEFNQVYTPIHYLNFILKITLILMILFISYHYIKARTLANDRQYTLLELPGEKETLKIYTLDQRSMNQSIELSHMKLDFKNAYLGDDRIVYILFEISPVDPYVIQSVLYDIQSCNDQTCVSDSRLDFGSYYRDMRFEGMGFFKFKADQIPDSITLTFQHKILKDVQKIFELETGTDNE